MKRALVAIWLAVATTAAAQGVPPIAEIRVHGNHSTPDADVVAASGLAVGQDASPSALEAATRRLRASGRFRSAEVLRRTRSIDDPDDVLVVIVIEEAAGASPDLPRPGWLGRTAAGLMWIPVLTFDDAYGASYGVRVAAMDVAGRDSRLSVPLVWGGQRQAGVELVTPFSRGPLTRLVAAGDLKRTEHPAFDVGDRRSGGRLRLERAVASSVVLSATADVAAVKFGDTRDRAERLIAGLDVDTRADPAVPRNAVWGRATIERLRVDAGARRRHVLDANGAVGLFKGTALSARVFQTSADGPLPPFEQAWIGGAATVRGYKAGYRVADNAAGASLAYTKPFGSALSIAHVGLRAFVDWAAVYAAGTSWRDASYDRGIGAGAFATAGSFVIGLDVARGRDQTRVHLRIGLGM